MAAYIGIDKGGTRHNLVLADARGEVILRRQHATDRQAGAEAELTSLRADITALIEAATDPVAAIGISFGGPVDVAAGTTILSHHVEGWENLPICARFEEWFAIPTALENDANVGALGEWRFGAGLGCDDLVYINVGTGIGGGIIANGHLVRGVQSLAGEIGHLTIDPTGPVCTCGRRGCLEAFASGPNLERRFAERYCDHPDGREIFRRAGVGNPEALALIRETADYLARGLGAAISLLNPARVVLGGGLCEAGALLFDPLNAALPAYVLPQARGVRVIPAVLGYDAGVRGAVALAMDHASALSPARPTAAADR